MESPNMRFPSKIDGWIGLLLAVGVLVPLGVAVAALVRGDAIGLVPCACVFLLYAGLVYPMTYEVRPDALVIRFGLVRSRIPYARIRRVVPTRNPLSNPALSLDRLHVDAGSSAGPCISPREKAAFLAALAEHTPHLVRVGDALLPRSG